MTEKIFKFPKEDSNKEKAIIRNKKNELRNELRSEKDMLKAEAKLDTDESSTSGEDSFVSDEKSTTVNPTDLPASVFNPVITTEPDIVEQDQAIYEKDKADNPKTVTPTWKREEVWVLHQQDTHPRKISQKVQLSLSMVNKIIEQFTEQEKSNPEQFNADRDVLRNAFITKAWEIIRLADDLTLQKLQEGKASALQANIIAGVKIDKILVLQGKANQISEQKHYLDKDMFKDLAKILTKRTYEHR